VIGNTQRGSLIHSRGHLSSAVTPSTREGRRGKRRRKSRPHLLAFSFLSTSRWQKKEEEEGTSTSFEEPKGDGLPRPVRRKKRKGERRK